MTNHPNRSRYDQLIAKLQGLSVSRDVAADARRLARDIYEGMIASQRPVDGLMSSASYRNLYGPQAVTVEQAQRESLDQQRANAMARARARAEDFLDAWGL